MPVTVPFFYSFINDHPVQDRCPGPRGAGWSVLNISRLAVFYCVAHVYRFVFIDMFCVRVCVV